MSPADPKSRCLVFGGTDYARMLMRCIEFDSGWAPAGFCVHASYREKDELDGHPVLALEEVLEADERPAMVLGVGYRDINRARAALFDELRGHGIALLSYFSGRASTWPDLQAGEHVIVYEMAVVQPFVQLGNNVVVRSSAHLSHHCHVEDHAFISASVALAGGVRVGTRSFVGVGATVRDGVHIAPDCVIAAGAVVVADTEPGGVYAGVPARRVREVADLERI